MTCCATTKCLFEQLVCMTMYAKHEICSYMTFSDIVTYMELYMDLGTHKCRYIQRLWLYP